MSNTVTGFAVYQRCGLYRFEGVVCPVYVVAASRIAIEASCVNSLRVSGIVKINGELKEGSPDRHLELLLPDAHGRKVR